MPSAAASAILEGMPEAADLRVLRSDGVTWVFAGKTALFRFADGDTAMRNIAVAALRQIGFSGTQVAAALGLTTNYVATLHQRAQRDGTAGLVRPRGRPAHGDGARLGAGPGSGAGGGAGRGDRPPAGGAAVHGAAAARPGPGARRAGAGRSCRSWWPGGGPGGPAAGAGTGGRAGARRAGAGAAGAGAAAGAGCRAARVRRVAGPAEGSGVFSRYAGAMLLHAYPGRAGEILPDAAGGEAREAALLSAVSMCFALGAATAEQVKHLAPAEAGPLAGLAALPSLRTLRPRAGRDRRRRRPAGAAGGVRGRDAGGQPGDLRGVLRR